MSRAFARYIAKQVLGERIENDFGKENVHFEYAVTRINRKRLGISDHDSKVLTKVKRRAQRLDARWSFLGIEIGWSSIIAIIPVVGDILDTFMALMVIRTCQQVDGGLPKTTHAHMMFNVALDFVVGLIPVIGDLADIIFRANTKNAIIFETFLRQKGAKGTTELS